MKREGLAILGAGLALAVSGGAASPEAGAVSGKDNRDRGCRFNEANGTHDLFDISAPHSTFRITEAFPMGRTDIVPNGDTNSYGELGLVAVKMTFANRHYICVVPVAEQGNSEVIKVEAFSLRNSCLPAPQPARR